MKLKVIPVAQVIISAITMFALAKTFPSKDLVIPEKNIISTVILFLGITITLLGVIEFRKKNTTLDPRHPEKTQQLVTTGIYRLSRNPMYLGFLITLISWFIALANIVSFMVIPFFVVFINRFQIKPEETLLLQKFSSVYSQYCKKSRRWI
ncbi:MAG: isoprenylcysteine carboxylmethyltransferase family protein [Gammaproteobacteria bacterium]|nr:isoprenylcysteine carboxylmethyltransferase family protein [Gammaproteobacteria bacterium]